MKILSELINPEEIISSTLNLSSKVVDVLSDSRRVKPGSLFVAIRGIQSDGHQFVPEVLAKGGAAVVDRNYSQNPPGILKVHSTREIVGKIASRFWNHPTQQFRLVGVTGTNGKTTTTFLLDQVWAKMGFVTGLLGTVTNKIGQEVMESSLTTPGPIELQEMFHRMVQHRVALCAMEVSSIALDQDRTLGSHFALGVFTNFTQDHLDYHLTMENYFESKIKFFKNYQLPCIVVNLDDDKANSILKTNPDSKQLTFSLRNSNAAFHVLESTFKKTGTSAKIKGPQGIIEITSPLIGAHNLQNILSVLAVIEGLGLDISLAAKALSTALGAPGRLERVMVGDYYPNIFVDYAHSDDALENVLKALNQLRGGSSGKIITVFGCGGDRDRTKRPKMAKVASQYSDVTIITSDNPRTEDPELILTEIERGIDKAKTLYFREVNRREAIYMALKNAKPEDIVLIAGKGHENYQIIGTQKHDFDDKLVVKDYYSG